MFVRQHAASMVWLLVVGCGHPSSGRADGGGSSDAEGYDGRPDGADAPFTCQVPGSLDESFGVGGVVPPIFGIVPGRLSVAMSVLVDSSGRIVIAGEAANGRRDCAVVRLLADGTRDPSFGASGVVLTGVAQNECWFEDIALQPDGKLVAVGGLNEGTEPSFTHRLVVMRFLANGDLDPGFGQNGIVITTPAPYTHAVAVALDTNNQIVVAGQGWDGTDSDDAVYFVTLRYQSDGQLDPTFGSGGVAEPAFQNGYDLASDLALQPDGKILVSGTAGSYGTTPARLGVVRYNSNGTRDTQFGVNGLVSVDPPASDVHMAIDTSGRIMLVGGTSGGGLLARLQTNGTVDATFNAVTEPGVTYDRVAITARGIYAAGWSVQPAAHALLQLARYSDSGVLDTAFGTAGFGAFPTGQDWYSAEDLVEQPDEKVVVVGYVGTNSSDVGLDFLVARYCP